MRVVRVRVAWVWLASEWPGWVRVACDGVGGPSAFGKEAELLAHGGEAPTVNGAGTVLFEGGEVLFGAVAFMLGEAIERVLLVQGQHHAVAGNFGNDGGGGDREAEGIALDDGTLRQRYGWQAHGIQQKRLWGRREAGDGFAHGVFRSLQNILCVDQFDGAGADGDGDGALHDGIVERIASLRRELFGVAHTGKARQSFLIQWERKDDGGCHYRPGKTAATRFIHASDKAIALLEQGHFFIESRGLEIRRFHRFRVLRLLPSQRLRLLPLF